MKAWDQVTISPLPLAKTASAVSLPDLRRFGEGWLLSCDVARHSTATLYNRRLYLSKLIWFLEEAGATVCDTLELRQFFSYLNHGHSQPGGRWGNPQLTKPVSTGTTATYDRHLRTFYSWLVKEEVIGRSPMDKIPEPMDRPDQVDPFADEEVERLIAASKKSNYARRDEAIIWFLLDTGIRASELCAVRMRDVDLQARKVRIEDGKGGKARSVWFGIATAKALWNYLKSEPHDDEDPLFFNNRGEALTRSGLQQLIERLNKNCEGIPFTLLAAHI